MASKGEHRGSARPPRQRGDVQFPAALRLTITLMQTAASSERDIAETLRDLAAQAEGETAARRLRLAEDAVQGAQAAEKHGESLEQLAERWDEHADVAKLHRLLARAGQALTELARTQQEIADTFARLAGRDGSALAQERRRLATAAAAHARQARDQAGELRELIKSSAAGMRLPGLPEQDSRGGSAG